MIHLKPCEFYGEECRCDERPGDTERAPAPDQTIRGLVFESHDRAVRKGFHEDGAPPIPEALCLVHSEVSEALEDYRAGKMTTTIRPDGKPEGFPSELADIIIRVCHIAGTHDIDLAHEIELKSAFNETRPHKHGKRC